MKVLVSVLVLLLLLPPVFCQGQMFNDLAQSHIDANVPEKLGKCMRRDLKAYFTERRKEKVNKVEYEYLRKGPTQTGVSFPKYYLWVKICVGKQIEQGAVRVAAIDGSKFEVTHFISSEQIIKFPETVSSIFPSSLCSTIVSIAEGASREPFDLDKTSLRDFDRNPQSNSK